MNFDSIFPKQVISPVAHMIVFSLKFGAPELMFSDVSSHQASSGKVKLEAPHDNSGRIAFS